MRNHDIIALEIKIFIKKKNLNRHLILVNINLSSKITRKPTNHTTWCLTQQTYAQNEYSVKEKENKLT